MRGKQWWVGVILLLGSVSVPAQAVEDFTLFNLVERDALLAPVVSIARSCQGTPSDQRYLLVPANGRIEFIEDQSEQLNLWLAPLECYEEHTADGVVKRWRKYWINEVLDRESPTRADQRPVVVYDVRLPIDLASLVEADTVARMRAREPVKDHFFLGVEIDNTQNYIVQVNINYIDWGPDAPLYQLSFLTR